LNESGLRGESRGSIAGAFRERQENAACQNQWYTLNSFRRRLVPQPQARFQPRAARRAR
jgi:hypothetical protein